MKTYALEQFRRPPARLNGAQAVLYAYQRFSGDTGIPLSEMRPFGGGRAPGGICGALHAACTVAPEKAEVLRAEFAAITGSVMCEELGGADDHACEVCVAESARLLENALRGDNPAFPARP